MDAAGAVAMSHQENDLSDRRTLGFAGAAEDAFRYLTDSGFRVLSADATIVRYSSTRVFVNVYHGRLSYELGIEVGLVGSGAEPGYALEAFVRLSDPESASRIRNFVATTPDEVRVGLQRLAQQLKQHVEPALQGNTAIFAELHRQREEWSKSYAAEVLAGQIRPEADAAFRARDYRRFIELLSKIENALTSAEKQKLEYARRHVSR